MSGLDVDVVIDELKPRKMPSEAQIKELCEKATAILGEEDNVQTVQAPVTICGDLHGAPPGPPPRANRANEMWPRAIRSRAGGAPSLPGSCAAPRGSRRR